MIALVKEIIWKINREIGEVRKEFGRNMEEVLWEVKGASERWESEFSDAKKNLEREMREMKKAWEKERAEIKSELKGMKETERGVESTKRRNGGVLGTEENRRLII